VISGNTVSWLLLTAILGWYTFIGIDMFMQQIN
jgi:hypothetical protein